MHTKLEDAARVYLRGHSNILKRVLIHTAALNLGLLMRLVVGVGTPRSLQGRLWTSFTRLLLLWCRVIKEYFAVSCACINRRSSLIGMRTVLCS